jgi:hypothetical protein
MYLSNLVVIALPQAFAAHAHFSHRRMLLHIQDSRNLVPKPTTYQDTLAIGFQAPSCEMAKFLAFVRVYSILNKGT